MTKKKKKGGGFFFPREKKKNQMFFFFFYVFFFFFFFFCLFGARAVYFTHSLLMQSSVALSLHFGWDSQLNTSEMFWIDISRWMIRSRCRWILVYLLWRSAHCF